MKVEIYGKDGCPYCVKAKEACENANIPYTYINIVGPNSQATKADVQARINALGHSHEMRTVPQIFVDDKWIGGYDNLVAAYPWAKIYNEKKK